MTREHPNHFGREQEFGEMIFASLKRAYLDVRLLCRSVSALIDNLEWLSQKNERNKNLLFLLDFDVICGAIRPLGIQGAIDAASKGLSCDQVDDMLSALVGPQVVRHLLSRLERYCIPHGTVGELLRYQRKLATNIESDLSSTIETFKRAEQSDDPIRLLQNHLNDSMIRDAILKALQKISCHVREYKIFEYVYKHAEPIKNLVNDRPQQKANPYLTAFNLLQLVRPEKSENNFFDALNVASLVKLYNSPVQGVTHTSIPMLISETARVTNFSSIQDSFQLPSHNKFQMFSNVKYPLVSIALNQKAHGRDDIVLNEAKALLRHANALANTYIRVKNAIVRGAISAIEYDAPEWTLLRNRRIEFTKQWDDLILPITTANELDQLGCQNLLVTDELVEITSALQEEVHDKNKIRKHIGVLADRMETIVNSDRLLQSMTVPQNTISSVTPSEIDNTFRISILPPGSNDGRPLCKTEPGTLLSDFDPAQHPWDDRSRVVVHFDLAIHEGAFLSFDFWRDRVNPSRQRIGLTWNHHRPLVALIDLGVHLLKQVSDGSDPDIRYVLFTTNGKISGSVAAKDKSGLITKTVKKTKDIDSIEIMHGDLIFLADYTPIEATEAQCYFTCPAKIWKPKITKKIAEMVSGMNRFYMAESRYRELINHVISHTNCPLKNNGPATHHLEV